MKLYRIFIVLILSFYSLSSIAADATNTLIMLLATTKNMTADFKQVISDNKGKALQKSNGKMALLRPGKFRWDVTNPIKQLIVTNGSKLWIYDPDLNQVTIRKLTKEIGKTPALLLMDSNHALTNDFEVASYIEDRMQWFNLTPKNRDSMFSLIKLGFVMADGVFEVRRMVLRDNLGHVTAIEFNNVISDRPVPNSLFDFTPPANVDVINDTET